ncbi:Conserved_hypothetical protein [Hexamita inflata]|uniref:Transmembrane protein n=1 Tax=Hexamita inflata TaxID=28002 RepID=A0AA86R2Q4_9EUKA|nr:Conserved hypothetical protein [Hexamita inflata]
MNLIIFSTQLNCFDDNTQVVLSKQSRQPTFTAQILTTETDDYKICQKLIGSPYTISLDLGSFTFTYATSLTLTGSIQLMFPCNDVNNCNDAFLASSASFKLVFTNTNTIVQDTVSVFKIDLFNRLNCIENKQISYSAQTQEIQIIASIGSCKAQIRQDQSAVVKIIVNSDLIIQKSMSLVAVNQLSDLFQNMVFNCLTDFTGTEQRICQRILIELQQNMSSQAELTVFLPAIIPDGSASYSRESAFQLYSIITATSSSFVKEFDCFTSNQQAVFFTKQIRMTYILNSSAINCIKPYEQFIGDTDHVITTLIITDSQNTIQFDFNSTSKVIQQANIWLECQYDVEGEQACKSKINQFKTLSSPQGLIQRSYMKGDIIVKSVQNDVTVRNTKHNSVIIILNQSQICMTTTSNDEETAFYQIQVDLMIGTPRFEPTQNSNLLTIHGQIYFPGNITISQSGSFCFNISLSQIQLQQYKNIVKDKSNVTGVVSFISSNLPVDKLTILDESDKIDYMYVLSAILVLSSVIWYVIVSKKT